MRLFLFVLLLSPYVPTLANESILYVPGFRDLLRRGDEIFWRNGAGVYTRINPPGTDGISVGFEHLPKEIKNQYLEYMRVSLESEKSPRKQQVIDLFIRKNTPEVPSVEPALDRLQKDVIALEKDIGLLTPEEKVTRFAEIKKATVELRELLKQKGCVFDKSRTVVSSPKTHSEKNFR